MIRGRLPEPLPTVLDGSFILMTIIATVVFCGAIGVWLGGRTERKDVRLNEIKGSHRP